MAVAPQDYETFNGNWEPPPNNTAYQTGQTAQSGGQSRAMAPVSTTSPFATMYPNMSQGQLQRQAMRSQFATNHPVLSGMMNGPLQRRNVAFQDVFTSPGSVANAGYQAQVDSSGSGVLGMPRMRPAGGPGGGPGQGAFGQMFPRMGQMVSNMFQGPTPMLSALFPRSRPAGLGAQPTTTPAGNIISYNYGGDTIRNQPLAPNLVQALNQAAQAAGITQIRVTSGGQDATGENRTGSTRHDHGNAGDIQLVVNGRVLDFTNPADQEIYQDFVREARAAGVTGVGAGTNYMGNDTIHVGYGNEAVWGGTGANAAPPPDWLVAAYNGGS
jgi:hypothetical protein